MKAPTPGQVAYIEDCRRCPCYPGTNVKRPAWDDLEPYAQSSWERNPTPRTFFDNNFKAIRA